MPDVLGLLIMAAVVAALAMVIYVSATVIEDYRYEGKAKRDNARNARRNTNGRHVPSKRSRRAQ